MPRGKGREKKGREHTFTTVLPSFPTTEPLLSSARMVKNMIICFSAIRSFQAFFIQYPQKSVNQNAMLYINIKFTLGISPQGFHCEDGDKRMARLNQKMLSPLMCTKLLLKARDTIIVSVKMTSLSDFQIPFSSVQCHP